MPKPLQLALLSSTPLGGPSSPLSSSPGLDSPVTPPPAIRRPANNRRQSSISYVSSNGSPRTPRHALTRSMSYSASSCRAASPSPVDFSGRIRSPSKAPLTVVEKHADLLNEMAAKESVCLELKSQLAIHEAELQTLKQKWQQIVNRGDPQGDDSTEDQTPSSPSPSPAPLAQDSLIGGITGGMKDMGRYIAAGISELAPVVAPLPPPATPMRRTHSARTSTASSSTSSSGMTRISESSASSLDDAAVEELEEDVEKRDVPQPLPLPLPRLSSPPLSPLNPTRPRHAKRLSMTADFPTVPGIGIASLMSNPAVSSWFSNVGNKWGEIQKGQTYTKGHERATSLINDLSHSLFPPQPLLSTASSSPDKLPSDTLEPIHEFPGYDPLTQPTLTAEPDILTLEDEWNW